MSDNVSHSISQRLLEYEMFFQMINKGTGRVFIGTSTLVSDFKNISNPVEADKFFEVYGIGNATQIIHNPFERHLGYEMLLSILKEIDAVQYRKIHKGTPYFFIAWTSYQYFNFAKATFYIDAAVSEDLKIEEVKSGKSLRQSLNFFLLKENAPSEITTYIELGDVVQKSFTEYAASGARTISIDNFRNKFIQPLLYGEPKGRSVLTAFYTFLLEYEEKRKQIELRSDNGGSIQPFLDHLFDGARILESVIELSGSKGNDLEKKIGNSPSLMVTNSLLKGNKSLASAELQYTTLKDSGATFQDYNFASAYIIRNTTGHSLLWPDQFASLDSYTTLYTCLLNSILWSIQKLWLSD